ncbi:thioredoxin-dependent thiol peroxidase [Ancylobacter oerskovii]|uniref:thioredoxin-dependent peroxiredoxin n=1 Tax=Ancylobacter oerskovii TaxID=459519 RepID=A0ABW4Z3H5_9HYPH|nr:thioredoxin-dependent thiol peroxidase [Ancylobacter oerskovii]
MTTIAAGEPAPDFELPGDDGKPVRLADFRGRKLVLYFYPKASTPGCALEAHDFNRLLPDFEKAGTAVLGVSADPAKALVKFRSKECLAFPLATDEAHDMLAAYGVWGEKSLYGKTFMGITRATVLIDDEGRIARIWPKVKVAGHAEDVLEAARAL